MQVTWNSVRAHCSLAAAAFLIVACDRQPPTAIPTTAKANQPTNSVIGLAPVNWPYDPGRNVSFRKDPLITGPTVRLPFHAGGFLKSRKARQLPPPPNVPVDTDSTGGGGGTQYPPLTSSLGGETDAHADWILNVGRGVFVNNAWIGYNPSTGQWVSLPNISDALLYAPTHLPAGGSCIEATIMHIHHTHWQKLPYDHAIGFYDWCGDSAFHNVQDLTSPTFQSKYASIMLPDFNAEEMTIELMIVADNPNAAPGSSDCWTAYLFDGPAQMWDNMYRSCGVSQVGYNIGWAMHESSDLGETAGGGAGCPTTASLGGSNYDLAIDGTWQKLLEVGDPSDTGNPKMTSWIQEIYYYSCFYTGREWSIYQEPFNMGYNGWFGLTPGAS